MHLLEVYNPVAQQRGALQPASVNPRPSTLDGKTIGLLWNGFRNGDVVLKRLGEMLKERFSDVRTPFYVGGHPAPEPVLAKAAIECDVVIGAAAD